MGEVLLEPAAQSPAPVALEGRFVSVVPLRAQHAADLWQGTRNENDNNLWTYLFDGPYENQDAFAESIAKKSIAKDALFFAILDKPTGRATGHACYMRIEPAHACIEVGSILYTPALQKTPGATEAMYLMARHVFEDLHYRRYEWKCHSLNAPSRAAALRLGFQYEGLFRQHMIIKGRNRDTTWFAMLDREWPARKAAFENWLSPANFDSAGRQITPLAR